MGKDLPETCETFEGLLASSEKQSVEYLDPASAAFALVSMSSHTPQLQLRVEHDVLQLS